MIRKFEILKIIKHHNRGQFIFARHIDPAFSIIVKDGSIFGGIPIYHYLEMYSSLPENEKLPTDRFVFRPLYLKGFPDGYFKEGQIVELLLAD